MAIKKAVAASGLSIGDPEHNILYLHIIVRIYLPPLTKWRTGRFRFGWQIKILLWKKNYFGGKMKPHIPGVRLSLIHI